MRRSILSGIKGVVSEMVDGNGKVRSSPIPNGVLAKKMLSEDRIKFLSLFVELLLNTDFTKENTKAYLLAKSSSYAQVADKLSAERGVAVNQYSLQSTVWLDKNRIEKHFTNKILLDVIEYTNTDISKHTATLMELMQEYGKSNLLGKNLIIELPEVLPLNAEVSDEELNEFFSYILPYTTTQAKFVSESLSTKVVSYCKYLLNGIESEMTDEEIERKNKIIALLEE